MAELKIKKGDQEVFRYETKENKNKGKKFYRRYGLSRFEFNLLWTGLWFVFMLCLCGMFETLGPLWLLIFWLMGYKW